MKNLHLGVYPPNGRVRVAAPFPTVPPYGYRTDRSGGRSVVCVDVDHADNVNRIFHLYAFGHCTLDMIISRLAAEGRVYKAKQPHWVRSKSPSHSPGPTFAVSRSGC